MPLHLPQHRFRNSFSASSTTGSGIQTASSISDVHATVATMRWAAACVDISPLALPSPEHELTDPMRGVTATIPGSLPQDSNLDYTLTPGGTRRSKLNGFWEGTTDIDKANVSSSRLEVVVASPVEDTQSPTSPSPDRQPELIPSSSSTDLATVSIASAVQSEPIAPLSLLSTVPPATAPVVSDQFRNPQSSGMTDYFGDFSIPPSNSKMTMTSTTKDTSSSPASSSSSGNTNSEHRVGLLPPPIIRHDDSMENVNITSVPALPRRLALTRQTSSPLPESIPHEPRPLGGRLPSENISSLKLGRAAKEERMFNELGYLAPPYPPDELERRRALYK